MTFKSKIEDTFFRLLTGEKFRTSSIIVMPYKCDMISSHNLWRRFVKDELSPLEKENRPHFAPISAVLWGGLSSKKALERIDFINKNHIPFDCIWIDAGWYGIDTEATPDEFEGDWDSHNGDWRVSPNIHPGGLKDVSKAVHDGGRQFLLWFEPERLIYTTPVALEHPEYLLSSDNPDDKNRLLNLGNRDAWSYCYNMLEENIREIGIDVLRIDFNTFPLFYWKTADSAGRRGITEIKYMNGFYELWDALLEKFPKLLIDNCASGGRRIDAETIRRGIPLWRSDLQCSANYDIEGAQCHNQTFNLWLPYSGTGSGRAYDEYRVRSAFSGGMSVITLYSENESIEEDAEEKSEFLKKYIAEAVMVRPYFSEDFYPLTEVSDRLDIWCANQFDRLSEKDGMIQIFRRENSPYETACFKLYGLDKNSDYLFTDIDGGNFTFSGRELSEKGFNVTIPEKQCAKIFIYKEI